MQATAYSGCCRPLFTRRRDDPNQGPDCDLREFPAGLQRFNGIPFLVGKEPRACIVLRSSVSPFPEAQPEAVTLPVGRRTLGFWFFHAGTHTGHGQR